VKLPWWKDSDDGKLALQTMADQIESGRLKYLGEGTFQVGQPMHIYLAPNGALITVTPTGNWNSCFEPRLGPRCLWLCDNKTRRPRSQCFPI
jgi:hypothetical protein